MQLSGRGVAMSFFASCVFTIVPAYVLLLAKSAVNPRP